MVFLLKAKLRLHLAHDFLSEVVLALFKAFTHLVTNETNYLEGIADELTNGLVAILNKGLLEEADFLVVLLDTAVDHLLDDCFGLRLGLVERLCTEVLLLLLDISLVDIVRFFPAYSRVSFSASASPSTLTRTPILPPRWT